jgi:hypothetical protein
LGQDGRNGSKSNELPEDNPAALLKKIELLAKLISLTVRLATDIKIVFSVPRALVDLLL